MVFSGNGLLARSLANVGCSPAMILILMDSIDPLLSRPQEIYKRDSYFFLAELDNSPVKTKTPNTYGEILSFPAVN